MNKNISKSIYDQGDLVWVDFDPAKGHEEKGRRPALVFSIGDTQRIDGLMMVLPITTTENVRSLSVAIETPEVHGKILVDQIRTIDSKSPIRNIEFIGHCPKGIFKQVDDLFDQLIHK